MFFPLRVVRNRSGMSDGCVRNITIIQCDMSESDSGEGGQVSTHGR